MKSRKRIERLLEMPFGEARKAMPIHTHDGEGACIGAQRMKEFARAHLGFKIFLS